MKTTLDLPDDLFKRAKIHAISHGLTFKDLVSKALEAKLSPAPVPSEKPWMKLASMMPQTPEFREEVARIQKIIDAEFGQVDEDDWK